MNLDRTSLEVLQQLAESLADGFPNLPDVEATPLDESMRAVLEQTAAALTDNFPYHHPYYLGQMLKPPHPVAHLAYTLAMTLNPNNHALDGGRASSAMEKAAVRDLAAMFGWENALGHLCGGGTMANLEALWVARESTNRPGIAVSSQAHYTHQRCAALLQQPCHVLDVDECGRMSVAQLRAVCEQREVGTVVVTLGTTGLGAVDPLDEVLSLRDRWGFRVHVDAAYGGYFTLVETLQDETRRQFQLVHQADSIVIDPHKHGLQPYGCGCILFRDHAAARVYKHDSPYTYFTSDELHLGEISLECSRAGAAAVALWATMQRFPLIRGGEFARGLEQSRAAAIRMTEWISAHPRLALVVVPELDVVVWAVQHETASGASQAARRFFELAAERNVHLALLQVPSSIARHRSGIAIWDQPALTCLRVCLMKPNHLTMMPQILELLTEILDDALSGLHSESS